MPIRVVETALEPWRVLADHEAEMVLAGNPVGATSVFVGTMRDFNEDATVESMVLEHYPGMTEKYLQRICDEANIKWDLLDTLVMHRVGELKPGEPIVLIAVWSMHRNNAFEACRFLIEDLKSQAPFWKKEQGPTGSRWVEHNTPG